MSAHRKPVLPTSYKLEDYLTDAWSYLFEAREEIEALITTFRDDCLSERKKLRSKILEDSSALAETTSPGTCPYFLTFRIYDGCLDLYWVRTSFSSCPEGSAKKTCRRLAGGDTSLRLLFAEAHPDEIEIIRRHEEKARLFRRQWAEYSEVRKKLESFRAAHPHTEWPSS